MATYAHETTILFFGLVISELAMIYSTDFINHGPMFVKPLVNVYKCLIEMSPEK